jgi:hypothetical protein
VRESVLDHLGLVIPWTFWEIHLFFGYAETLELLGTDTPHVTTYQLREIHNYFLHSPLELAWYSVFFVSYS